MSVIDAKLWGRTATVPEIEPLKAVYAQWGRGNFRSRIGPYADGFAWGWSDEFPGLAGVFRDPASASRRLLEWLRQWKEWKVEAEEYLAAGDFVVVFCRYRGSGNASGVEVDTRGAHLWTMGDGGAVRLEIFSSPERALAAAGLEPVADGAVARIRPRPAAKAWAGGPSVRGPRVLDDPCVVARDESGHASLRPAWPSCASAPLARNFSPA